mgnify:CR=1 FL=1
MGLFDRNPNAAAYTGGKKHWADVIKNSGPGDLLIWRQPEEDFNTNSTLIVMPGEQAVFIRDGSIEQIFDNGRYTLSTDNYPFISRLRNAFTGGISTFNCVVYFVRTAHSAEIRWGTDSPLQVRDKLLGIATKVRARGSYKVTVGDPGVFLTKLIGNNIAFETQDGLNKYFASQFQGKIKATLTDALNKTDTELLGIEARLEEFADEVRPYFQRVLDEYGLSCEQFVISAMDIDDDELRRRYDEIGMEAIAKMRNAQADKAVMGVLGEDWGRQQAANILGNLSMNPGAGGVAAAGAGIGMGMAAGGAFNSLAQEMFAPMHPATTPQPASPAPSGRFRQQGATQNPPSQHDDPVEVLGKLKKLLDAGLIEPSEYEAKKAEILSRM